MIFETKDMLEQGMARMARAMATNKQRKTKGGKQAIPKYLVLNRCH